MKFVSNLHIIGLIVVLSTLGPSASDTYLTSLPYIAKYYSVHINLIQLSVFYFNIGAGLGTLVFGVLSDRYGRRKIIFICLVLGILSTLLCAVAHNVYILFCGKFIQGLSLSSCIILSKAITRDVTSNNVEMAKLSSKASIFFAIVVNTCLPIGGYIQQHLFWQAIFYFLSVYYLIVLIIIYYKLPETNSSMIKGPWSQIIKDFADVFININFLKYSINSALVFTAFSAYVTSVPSILENDFAISPERTSLLAIVLMCARMLAGYVNNLLLKKIKIYTILFFSSFIMLSSTVVTLLFFKTGIINVYSVFMLGFFFLFGGAITLINASSIAIGSFPDKSGTASSAYGVIQQICGGAMGSLLISILPGKIELNMVYLMLSAAILCIFLNKYNLKNHEV